MPIEKEIQVASALVGHGWVDGAAISVDAGGVIKSIDETQSTTGPFEDLAALPGMLNVHSHAFQRGFAGLSEFRTSQRDSFWTWRKLMYDFVGRLSPDDVFVIARQLYYEMLEAGYTSVGEFHYLHNAPDGTPYSDLSEMSQAILRAADETGIRMCLLPVLYQRSGFDSDQPSDGQKRFVLSDNQFIQLLESISQLTAQNPKHTFGMAIHSLRAVDPLAGNGVIAEFKKRFGPRPIHIHVAEQLQEVEDCLNVNQRRPVEHLFDHYDVDENWCLIHATHLNAIEVEAISQSGAVVGLCPTTEANLGDGIFPAPEYLAFDGKIAIGSDSHCSIDFREELRILEYGQRLRRNQRAILGNELFSVGTRLFCESIRGGNQSLRIKSGIALHGSYADIILIDRQHPTIAGAQHQRLVDRLVFCNHGNPIHEVIIGGQAIGIQSDEFQTQQKASAVAFNSVCKSLGQ